MKKTLPRLAGRTVFWLGWPLLYFILTNSTRTRVVIVANKQILVARGWLGDGRWELPGGGVHRGEDVLTCALREVKEETGIILNPEQLNQVEGFMTCNNKINFKCQPFYVHLDDQPDLSRQRHEISELKWIDPASLNENNIEAASLKIIQDLAHKSLL